MANSSLAVVSRNLSMNGFIEKVLVYIAIFILLMIVNAPSVDQCFTDNPSDQCEAVLVHVLGSSPIKCTCYTGDEF